MKINLFMKHDLCLIIGLILHGIILVSGCANVSRPPTAPTSFLPVANTPGLEIAPTLDVQPVNESSPTMIVSPPVKAATLSNPGSTPAGEGDGINHELVFAIRNPGRFSGENGQQDWLGWGADHLAIAPDGSFWIADTPADPDRLLHYSPQGELLDVLSMRIHNRQYWARDLFADDSGLWVLDNISQPGLIHHLDPHGELLASYSVPDVFSTYRQEETSMPGLWYILFADDDRVLLEGPVGIVELSITASRSVFKHLDGYPVRDHLYSKVENGFAVDGHLVPINFVQPGHFLNHYRLLGIAEDGSFSILEGEGNTDPAKTETPDEFVRRYDSSGKLLGIALIPIAEIHQQPALAIAPDGNVYGMFSFTDHSVEIYRLKFSTGSAPLLAPARQTPKTYFSPLLPAGIDPASDQDAAREAMLTFFANLANKKYDEAALLYGGTYDDALAMNVVSNTDSPGMAWQNICTSLFCLPISDILDTRQLDPDKYAFLVGFVHENGFRYDYGPCCGNFQPVPSSTWFVYSVTVQKVNDQWMVMGGPVPLP